MCSGRVLRGGGASNPASSQGCPPQHSGLPSPPPPPHGGGGSGDRVLSVAALSVTVLSVTALARLLCFSVVGVKKWGRRCVDDFQTVFDREGLSGVLRALSMYMAFMYLVYAWHPCAGTAHGVWCEPDAGCENGVIRGGRRRPEGRAPRRGGGATAARVAGYCPSRTGPDCRLEGRRDCVGPRCRSSRFRLRVPGFATYLVCG